ncbi:MAG: Rrf2 family transcriptional regulator [Eggerthellaceae bacterium]|nr:Rrf2 family transcriptional regulator [Eggerthellaceae bacterium]
MISTKGRYALRVLIDLAEQGADTPVPLKDIAKRQGISDKYLQHIAKMLVDCGLLVGTSGRGGGYLLAREPQECTVAEVLEATEGTLAPVACVACGAQECDRALSCKTLPMWKQFDSMSHEFFRSISIADLANGKVGLPA